MDGRRCRSRWLGRVDYAPALRMQEDLVAQRQRGEGEDTLLLLEHPHVVTLGRNAHEENLLVDRDALTRRGATVHEVGRGGDVTYHGPGQLVGYPILRLRDDERDAHDFLRRLEEVLILSLSDFGIEAGRRPPHTGVWVEDQKVAALGVRFSRWVTSHGLALNVDPDLDWFETIIPCGISHLGVTSMRELLGRPPSLASVRECLVGHFGAVFEREMNEQTIPQVREA